MNKTWIVAALVLGGAVPALADTPAPENLYVSADGTFGADTSVDWIAAGGGIAGGYRLNDTLWARGRIDTSARVGYGTFGGIGITLESPTRAHVDALVGLESRHCLSPATCLLYGADAGVRSPDSKYGAGFELVPRAGLDIGDEHLRFRPMVEAKVAWISGYDTEAGGIIPAFGLGLSLGVAYVW